LNTQPGDSSKGETGLAALPGREEDFREIFLRAYTYARELGAGMIHLLAGRSTEDVAVCETTFIDNVRWAADLCHGDDINVMLEPLNSTDVPGYLHSTSDETAHLIELIDRDNVKLQYDFYHLQIMEGNLARHIEKHLDKIGHIQFSSVPGRHEPQFGEVNVHHLFDFLDDIGYKGWIGCEYWAIGQTLDGLSWASKYGLGSDR
jgi:hydroxypyruvate isomerase